MVFMFDLANFFSFIGFKSRAFLLCITIRVRLAEDLRLFEFAKRELFWMQLLAAVVVGLTAQRRVLHHPFKRCLARKTIRPHDLRGVARLVVLIPNTLS